MNMNLRPGTLLALLLAQLSPAFAADTWYTSNPGSPGSPYPPGCITAPLRHLDLSGENVAQFFRARIWLEVVHRIESDDPYDNLGQVQLDMYRFGCAEPNRSVIIAEFTLPPEWVDPRKSQLLLPWLGGNSGFDPYPLEFRSEANSGSQNPGQFHYFKRAFGDYTDGWDDARKFSWRYVLDVPFAGIDAPKYYNGAFTFLLYRSDGEHFLTITVPETKTLLNQAASMPLSGRLSGNWVEEGSADQGLLISFSTPLPPVGSVEAPEHSGLLVFLSWFTFDAQGELSWLTGAARFAQGASEVLIPIEQVNQGVFLGGTPAQRSTVGNVQLRAVNCDRLELTYQLDDLGLGSDTMQLQRLSALEIADYSCRDYEGRQASIYPPETN